MSEVEFKPTVGQPGPEFRAWPKIPRLYRDAVITEKIDGTNAAVVVMDDGRVYAQSRKRLITPETDNFGFAAWVRENAAELRALGPGHHYGEWYGRGIQRGYGLDERRFALFAQDRYEPANVPPVVEFVPELYRGPFNEAEVQFALDLLRMRGSQAVPGFLQPEGVIVWHEAARQAFKVLLENDDIPKGLVA